MNGAPGGILLEMSQSSQTNSSQRFDTIDLLRGLSVLCVVHLHITILLGDIKFQTFPVWLESKHVNLGGAGVGCFFAISGFLITLTSIRRFGSIGNVVPSAFYRIRFARIAPPLFLLLCILSILHMANVLFFRINPAQCTLPQALFAVLTFRFNHMEAMHGWLPFGWVPLWTLSIEEMFYLCFPLLCALLARRRWGTPVFLAVLIGVVAIGPLSRISFPSNLMWAILAYRSNMDNIALGCIFGVFAARLLAIRPDRRPVLLRPLLLVALQIVGAVLMVFATIPAFVRFRPIAHMQSIMWHTSTTTTALGLGTCLVMLGSVLHPSRGLLVTAPLRWLGRYSYEVYLSHEFVIIGLFELCLKVHKGSASFWAVAMILLSGLLGYVVSRCFSEPMNRLLRGAPLPSQLKA